MKTKVFKNNKNHKDKKKTLLTRVFIMLTCACWALREGDQGPAHPIRHVAMSLTDLVSRSPAHRVIVPEIYMDRDCKKSDPG